MAYAVARPLDAALIPVIDIGPLRDGSDPGAVAVALTKASREAGFLYVVNHGVDEALIDAAREEAMAFFRADPAVKAEAAVSAKHRGWLATGGARMADDAAPDLKESFVWGYEDARGQTPDDHPLRGANRWPASHPALRTAAQAWFLEAHGVAEQLMRGFALGLGLDGEAFLESVARPMSRASFVYYPPQPEALGAGRFGVGPHTDFGVLTVLAQDGVGGLQVQDLAGDWVEAPPIPGALVVNVGDLLARWTAGRCRSTPHRVVNASGRERLSLVLAWDPEPQTMIDAAALLGPEGAEAPIACGDYLEARFARAFAYRAKP
ncbi:isopenicillin N synthase family dioxygenase [Rubrimonas cliftonensis]|uniref:2-oxoglutarate-dependent ethylene/succinate-forming enzyme n=1 Tax=Rubrimonas cliftonensis TaxID=89524 RepID=A0A1H4BYS6_9RHOB|nr:2OG-Fe(II) oxygenase family protein [Rubrimonas cliftonensis]SEA53230.1 Isopenicillin N synthase [Rubrimonas cliftonensis]